MFTSREKKCKEKKKREEPQRRRRSLCGGACLCVSVSVSENRFFPFSLFFLLICGKKEKKPCVWPQVGWGVALFAVNFLVLGQTGLDFLNARYTNVWKEVVFPSIVFPTSPTNRDRRSDETFALYVEVVCRNSEKTAAVDEETSVRPSRKTQNLWHLPLSCCVFFHDFLFSVPYA